MLCHSQSASTPTPTSTSTLSSAWSPSLSRSMGRTLRGRHFLLGLRFESLLGVVSVSFFNIKRKKCIKKQKTSCHRSGLVAFFVGAQFFLISCIFCTPQLEQEKEVEVEGGWRSSGWIKTTKCLAMARSRSDPFMGRHAAWSVEHGAAACSGD